MGRCSSMSYTRGLLSHLNVISQVALPVSVEVPPTSRVAAASMSPFTYSSLLVSACVLNGRVPSSRCCP